MSIKKGECPICKIDNTTLHFLHDNHKMCAQCLNNLEEKNAIKCPFCRQVVEIRDLPNETLLALQRGEKKCYCMCFLELETLPAIIGLFDHRVDVSKRIERHIRKEPSDNMLGCMNGFNLFLTIYELIYSEETKWRDPRYNIENDFYEETEETALESCPYLIYCTDWDEKEMKDNYFEVDGFSLFNIDLFDESEIYIDCPELYLYNKEISFPLDENGMFDEEKSYLIDTDMVSIIKKKYYKEYIFVLDCEVRKFINKTINNFETNVYLEKIVKLNQTYKKLL